MKLLVAGGAGYIGSHTTHQLVEAGHDVVVLDNMAWGHRWAIPEGVRLVEGNVGDTELVGSLLAKERFDGVLHFAANIEVSESVQDPIKYYRNNTLAALNLFENCVKAGVGKIVFSSTAAVYGEPEVSLLTEDQALKPVNPYGASKMMSERFLSDIAASSNGALRFVVLRYFNVAGARLDLKIGQATPKSFHLIKVAAEAALGVRNKMFIHGTDYPTQDGTCLRDYIHVEDLAGAHLNALEYLERGGASEVFNVGYGRPYSVRQVIETMKKVSGSDFPVEMGPRRPGDPSSLAADPSKIRRTLGWTPEYDDLELICRTAFEWEKVFRTRFRDQS